MAPCCPFGVDSSKTLALAAAAIVASDPLSLRRLHDMIRTSPIEAVAHLGAVSVPLTRSVVNNKNCEALSPSAGPPVPGFDRSVLEHRVQLSTVLTRVKGKRQP